MTPREQMKKRLQECARLLGLSANDPDDGWKLDVLALLMKPEENLAGKKKPGVQPDPRLAVDDLILMFGIQAAERDDRRPVRGRLRKLIRALAEANNWPTDDAFLETKRARYYRLCKAGTPERQAMAAVARDILPAVEKHFAKKMGVRN